MDDEYDPTLRDLTQAQFDTINSTIVAGHPNNAALMLDKLYDWLGDAEKSDVAKLIRESLVGKNPFADLVKDLMWGEAMRRAESELTAIEANLQQAAEGDIVDAWLMARAA